jgi:hypothetical protein
MLLEKDHECWRHAAAEVRQGETLYLSCPWAVDLCFCHLVSEERGSIVVKEYSFDSNRYSGSQINAEFGQPYFLRFFSCGFHDDYRIHIVLATVDYFFVVDCLGTKSHWWRDCLCSTQLFLCNICKKLIWTSMEIPPCRPRLSGEVERCRNDGKENALINCSQSLIDLVFHQSSLGRDCFNFYRWLLGQCIYGHVGGLFRYLL